jgi:hypothetical protein
MTTAFTPGQSWPSCSHSTSWISLLLGDEELDILAQRTLIALQRKNVIDDHVDCSLAAGFVTGSAHRFAIDRDHPQQF